MNLNELPQRVRCKVRPNSFDYAFSLIEFRVPYKSSAYKIIVDDVTNSIFKAGDVSDFVGKSMKILEKNLYAEAN
jgi:hypothetical protein